MRSDEIDLAFYCSHVAAHLIGEDNRFLIYAPVIMNGEVLVLGKAVEQVNQVETVGIADGREHLKKIIKEQYQSVDQIIELSPKALNYSLEDQQVQSAVMDISKASLLEEYQYLPISISDYISYVLVVRKDKVDTKAFKDYLETYNKVADEMRNADLSEQKYQLNKRAIEASRFKILTIEPIGMR